jgi:hypothetical protein
MPSMPSMPFNFNAYAPSSFGWEGAMPGTNMGMYAGAPAQQDVAHSSGDGSRDLALPAAATAHQQQQQQHQQQQQLQQQHQQWWQQRPPARTTSLSVSAAEFVPGGCME